MKSLTEQLKNAIRKRDGSLASLARETGIPQPVLHRFMVDERDIYLATADKLASHFGLKLTSSGKSAAPKDRRSKTSR